MKWNENQRAQGHQNKAGQPFEAQVAEEAQNSTLFGYGVAGVGGGFGSMCFVVIGDSFQASGNACGLACGCYSIGFGGSECGRFPARDNKRFLNVDKNLDNLTIYIHGR